MIYQAFQQKVNRITKIKQKSLTLQLKSIQDMVRLDEKEITLEKEICEFIVSNCIEAQPAEYALIKGLGLPSILDALASVKRTVNVSDALWFKFKDLEVAAYSGNLTEVMSLLEDDELKELAAFNQNSVLRVAAQCNHQDVVEFLLTIPCIKEYRISSIKYESESFSRVNFLNHLKFVINLPPKSHAGIGYLELAKELLLEGKISDLEWKFLPLILKAGDSSIKGYAQMVSMVSVLPSVRKRASEYVEFNNLLTEVKEWLKTLNLPLKQRKPQPVPKEVPHIGPYVVKIGVSPFNLVSYEKFLIQKQENDELRKYYTQEMLQQLYPDKFKPKSDVTHSFTIEGNKVKYNGSVRNQRKV